MGARVFQRLRWLVVLGLIALPAADESVGPFDEATLNALRASEDVEAIVEDGVMHITAFTT